MNEEQNNSILKIAYYSKYKHGYIFDNLIYHMYLQDIPGTVKIAIFGCFKFSKG